MKNRMMNYYASIALILVIGAVFLYRKPGTTYIVLKQPQPQLNPCPSVSPIVNNTNVPHSRRIMSGIPRDYALVGYLKNEETIFPLYGRASRTNAHRWNYHTLTDRLSNIPLPILSMEGRNCTLDLGCDELYDGQIVSIPGLLGSFGVHVYPKEFDRF